MASTVASNKMKLLLFNIQSLKKPGNKQLLEHFMNKECIDVAMLTETWLSNNSCSSLEDYKFVGRYRDDGFGGLGVYLRRHLRYTLVCIDPDMEIMAISTVGLKTNISFVLSYISPEAEDLRFRRFVDRLFEVADGMTGVVILAGDFNAKATAWGSSVTDRRGSTLLNMASMHGFRCMNNGDPTYSTVNQSASVLDLSFIRGGDMSFSWSAVNTKITGSNHYPIIITLDPVGVNIGRGKVLLRKRFLADIQNLTPGSLDELLEGVRSLRAKHTLQLGGRNKYRPKSWWNNDLDRLFRLRNSARKKFYLTKSPVDGRILEQAEDELSKQLFRARKENFSKLLDDLSNPANQKCFWRKLSHLKRFNRTKSLGNSWGTEEARKFLDLICPDDTPRSHNVHSYSPSSADNIPKFFFRDFKNFIFSRNPDSAPGPDGISYRILMNLPDSSIRNLFDWTLAIWSNLNPPQSWRVIKVFPILKKNKDPTNILNYRPICLMPVLLKITEHLIKIHVERHCIVCDLLPKRTYAFRKNRSTASCINDVLDTIYRFRERNYQVVAACLDIDKAYDRVNPESLFRVMTSLEFNPHLAIWIRLILNDRRLTLNGLSTPTNMGLAQGSTLSPLLFNIYTASLHSISSNNTILFQFADDFFLVCADPDFESARLELREAAGRLLAKCEILGLSINAEKSSVIHFNRRPRQLNMTLNMVNIPQVAAIRFLGRTMTYNNSPLPHIDQLSMEIRKSCSFMRILNNKFSGIDPSRALLIYKLYARPKIEYACSSFSFMSKKAMGKIQVIINDSLKSSLGLMRSSPNIVAYHMAAELPRISASPWQQ